MEIYKNTDVDVEIAVSGMEGPLTNFKVSLEKYGLAPIEFNIGEGVTIVNANIVLLRIEDNKMSTPGKYIVRLTAYENGNIRGLKPNPAFITVI